MPPLIHASADVVENVILAKQTFRLRIECPDLAAAIVPGQFLMLRLPGTNDPLLGRPFALYDTILDATGRPQALDVVFLVVGKMTGRMSILKRGDRIEVWGPLGNGFPSLDGTNHVALVAGGIGQTPFLAYGRALLGERGYGGRAAKRETNKVTLYYGARTADLLAGLDDFRSAGLEIHLATDDGSTGQSGFVTDLLAGHAKADHLVGCGPEPMLRALATLANQWKVPCHVSLETPMACGVGVCFSCVTRVKTPCGWDYQRTCVDGPVFDAATLEW
jgi:dihydroorotate dehydrogenase electron transfer subunit